MVGIYGEKGLSLIRNSLKFMIEGKRFDTSLLKKLNVISASEGNIEAEFTVDEEMTNIGGTLHGGCAASLIDVVSTVGLLTSKSGVPGVTVNLSVSYLKSVAVGESIVLDSKVIKLGRTLAFLDVKLMNKSTGAVVITGTHIKHIGGQ